MRSTKLGKVDFFSTPYGQDCSYLEIMELIQKNGNSSISYLIILSYGRDAILLKKTKNFQIGVVSPEL